MSNNGSSSGPSSKAKRNGLKWVKQIRGLPSNPGHNDYLKIDYIDVNLNNSRKLISNVNSLAASSEKLAQKSSESVGSLGALKTAQKNLAWLEGIDVQGGQQ